MTVSATRFDQELASLYDETRQIDPAACQECFRDALAGFKISPEHRLIDAGCGTGRIIQCLVPDLLNASQVCGIDISSAMLAVAKAKPTLQGADFRHAAIEDFARDPENGHRYDFVICHWLLHCTPNWKEILRSCVALAAPTGTLAWLAEDGDLYQALDGFDSTCSPLKRLFDVYYQIVSEVLSNHGLPPIEPSARAGTKLRNLSAWTSELAAAGWRTRPCSELQSWTRYASAEWVIDRILAPRAFTNLREIPAFVNAEAIVRLRKKFADLNLQNAGELMPLKFSAQGIIARRVH